MGTVCLLVELRYSLRIDQKQHFDIFSNFLCYYFFIIIFLFTVTVIYFYLFSALFTNKKYLQCFDLTLLVGRKEGHSACKNWVLVCWW